MLEIKNLSKTFNGRKILDNVSLTVNDGEILSIVGPSGAGKTTLLRCITGLELPDSGTFMLNGKQFDPANVSDPTAIIGVVFQDYQLFPNMTVRENITLAPTLALKQARETVEKTAEQLIAQLGLTQVADVYPYQLSGGQKQRVAIARALAMRPQILCYDEPTSALDPALRKTVEAIILSLKEDGMTQVVVTHDLDFAENIADQIFKVNEIK